MTLPVIFFGFTAAFLIGSLFHAVRGGNGWRLLGNLVLSALGFALGQAAGWWFGVSVYKVGVLDAGIGLVGSVLILILGDWLSRVKPPNKSGV